MIRILVIFILIFSIRGEVYAQNNNTGSDTTMIKKSPYMRDQIRLLKNGVLLVRLHSRSKAINALKEIGRNEDSEILSDKQTALNKKIIASFKANFTFCPAYFFFSSSSDSLLSGLVDKIVFLNPELQPDPSIKFNTTNFCVAEFGDIEPDTAKYFSEDYLYRGENGLEKRSAYYGSPHTGLRGFRILSDKLIQLKRPFPYYLRAFAEFPNTKKVKKTIVRLNEKLINYYNYVLAGK